MSDILTTIKEFFGFVIGIIKDFFGFFGGLLPSDSPETPDEPASGDE